MISIFRFELIARYSLDSDSRTEKLSLLLHALFSSTTTCNLFISPPVLNTYQFHPKRNYVHIMSETTRLKSTVYVGGLDQGVTAHTLAEAFVPFGEVVDISLPKPDQPNSTEVHRGFGYVEFDLPQDAKEAIDNMDGSEIYGRTIKVAAAKPQKDANEGLGSKTAIWEQVRWTRFYTYLRSILTGMPYRRGIWPNMLSVRRIG